MPSPRLKGPRPKPSRKALRSMATLTRCPFETRTLSPPYAMPTPPSLLRAAGRSEERAHWPAALSGPAPRNYRLPPSESPAQPRPHPPLASLASTSVLRALGRRRRENTTALSGSAAEPVSGAAGVTCPALGAAGSGGDRGLSSRRRPRLLSRCRHARLLHHFLQGRACALVLPGRERLMHRAR